MINALFSDSSVGRAIAKDLHFNLNNPDFKRVDGVNNDANEHFYTKVFSDDRLEDFGRVCHVKFPIWGSMMPNGLQAGGKDSNGKWVTVGIRLGDGHNSWSGSMDKGASATISKARQEKRVRTNGRDKNDVRLYKPQIAVTIRPLELYKKWRMDDRYSAISGSKDAEDVRRKLRPCLAKNPQFLAASTKILPLLVYLPIIGDNYESKLDDGGRVIVRRHAIRPTEVSRHYLADTTPEDDFERQTDLKIQEDRLISICRDFIDQRR